MYKIKCEWDIGHENVVFHNKEDGYRWLLDNMAFIEDVDLQLISDYRIAKPTEEDRIKLIDEFFLSGFIGFDEIKLWTPGM